MLTRANEYDVCSNPVESCVLLTYAIFLLANEQENCLVYYWFLGFMQKYALASRYFTQLIIM